MVVNDNSSQTEIIEENKHYDDIDKIDGSLNKTNANMVSEVDIPQVIKNENLQAKFIENFDNLAVQNVISSNNDSHILENQTEYFAECSKPSRDDIILENNKRDASKSGENNFAILEADLEFNQENKSSSVMDRPISLLNERINDEILEDFEDFDNIIEDNLKTIEEPVPLGKEQIVTIAKSPHNVEKISQDFEDNSLTQQLANVSCKMTETVQNPGVSDSVISDGTSTIVHKVADHQIQEERWDYTVSQNLPNKVQFLGKKHGLPQRLKNIHIFGKNSKEI